MKNKLNNFHSFNSADTLLVISSFPKQGEELAKENAVAWYTHQLLKHFPSDQKVVIIAEKRSKADAPWKLKKNVLVLPVFSTESPLFFQQVIKTIGAFDKTKNILIQFEFNSFKNDFITGAFPLLLATLKLQKKHLTFALHQVIEDVAALSGHLQIKAGSVKAKTLNTVIRSFYRSLQYCVDQVIVFDEELRQRLSKYLSEDKITVIPMGNDQEIEKVSKATARKHFAYTPDDFVILAFGYHSWYKGTDWIVHQVGKLAKKHADKNIRLLLAGSTSPTVENVVFETDLKKALKKYKNFTIETGYISDREVPLCFAASDLVVLPYRAMMSSSGTLSHALSYEKPFLLSEKLAPVFKHTDFAYALAKAKLQKQHVLFSLEKTDCSDKIVNIINSKSLQRKLATFSSTLKQLRTWKSISKRYVQTILYERVAISPSRQMQKLPELSIFFPLYNEAENVKRLVHHALSALPKVAKKFEIILVDDGSTDTTAKLANALSKKYKAVKVIHQANGGYGRALRTGFESAKYEWIFFSDGDLQFDLNELSLFLPYVSSHDVVIGYRKNRADSAKRLFLASLLKIWNKVFFSFPSYIKDIDCAYKLFHKNVVQTIFPLQSYGAMISTEMLLKVIDNGFTVQQVGVTHLPRKFGEPTGAKPHVIIGAMKETAMIVKSRLLNSYLPNLSR